ncbi:hypothetical protein PCC7418_0500 [Halothece sp. PCC 7418]|nr:hypothetical protein PCC7418_0500 [Halothece sp. PCC 7418]
MKPEKAAVVERNPLQRGEMVVRRDQMLVAPKNRR